MGEAGRWGGGDEDAGKQGGAQGAGQVVEVVAVDEFAEALGNGLFALVGGDRVALALALALAVAVAVAVHFEISLFALWGVQAVARGAWRRLMVLWVLILLVCY